MDIVKQLRKQQKLGWDNINSKELIDFGQAADEIERLREALKEIDKLKLCVTMIVEMGLNDPAVNEFILSALQQKDSE